MVTAALAFLEKHIAVHCQEQTESEKTKSILQMDKNMGEGTNTNTNVRAAFRKFRNQRGGGWGRWT